jgi:hypothetical protein
LVHEARFDEKLSELRERAPGLAVVVLAAPARLYQIDLEIFGRPLSELTTPTSAVVIARRVAP